MKTEQVLLQLIVPARQASLLSDFLLAQAKTPFFTAIEAAGFGQPHEQLSPDEQVEGAQRKVKFEIELNETAVQPLLMDIQTALPTLVLFYRVLPIKAQGVLGT